MTSRAETLDRLGRERFDVLVVGGGIVGAAVARDAVLRGLSVALVDKGDFASGTSSKTSKLVHGGLRYLEQGRVGLVWESLRERRTLLRIAPGLVEPISLALPIREDAPRPPWQVAIGLALYDGLARGRSLPAHRMLSPREAARLEPGLEIDGLAAAALFSDCRMDDARLCLETVLDAARRGAACLNHAAVLSLPKGSGGLEGAVLEDGATGRRVAVSARAVVNATGPWGDALRRESDPGAEPRLAPTKGTHVVLPSIAAHALFLRSPDDGRMVFVLPWEGHSLVGTTESGAGDLDDLRATGDEVEYLLRVVRSALPRAEVSASDVVATFAGARPLLAHEGKGATEASREHAVEIDRNGLVSVMGGKYTTHRAMAKDAVDALVPRFGFRARPSSTARVALRAPARASRLELWKDVADRLPPPRLARLLARYGEAAWDVLALVREDPSLAEPVCPHHDVALAELAHGARSEMALTVEDLLLRRTKLGYSRCGAADALPRVAALLERHAGVSPEAARIQARAHARP